MYNNEYYTFRKIIAILTKKNKIHEEGELITQEMM